MTAHLVQGDRLLALGALLLGACAVPATPNDFPTRPPTANPPTASAPLPTAAATLPPTTIAAVRAISVKLEDAKDVAVDANGNLYVAGCHGIWGNLGQIDKIDTLGLITVVARSDNGGFSGDGGPARAAALSCVASVAFDGAGNLFFADNTNNRVRRIDRSGIITTVAGSGPAAIDDHGKDISGAFGGDGGPASAARLNSPTDIVIDPAGNLYIADTGNDRIRKVDTQGIITTLAGTGEQGFAGDGGPATAAQLRLDPFFNSNIAVDAQGNVFVADTGNSRVRRIDRQGIITTIAGTGGTGHAPDGGLATETVLTFPVGLVFDRQGNLYVATENYQMGGDNRVRRIDSQGRITTFAGGSEHTLLLGDGGPATSAYLGVPLGLAFDTIGNLYIADSGGVTDGRVRKVNTSGIITTVAGGAP